MQTYKPIGLVASVVLLVGCSSYFKQSDVCVDRWYGYHPKSGCPSVAKAAAPDVSGEVALASAARLAALEGDRQRLANELETARRQNQVLSSQVNDLNGQLAASSLLAADLAAARQRNSDLEAQLADREKEYSTEMARLKEAERGLVRALKPQIEEQHITIDLNNERLLMNLASGYLFGSGEDQLKPAGAETLKQVGAILHDFPEYKVHVEGHTDNRPILGALKKKFPSNKELSEARAQSAVEALESGGLSGAHAMGAAETKPVMPNTTGEGRAKNRRVEIIVTR
ncbi:MAG TPA: flagellar motor protein MotB [Nitrospira sp.]